MPRDGTGPVDGPHRMMRRPRVCGVVLEHLQTRVLLPAHLRQLRRVQCRHRAIHVPPQPRPALLQDRTCQPDHLRTIVCNPSGSGRITACPLPRVTSEITKRMILTFRTFRRNLYSTGNDFVRVNLAVPASIKEDVRGARCTVGDHFTREAVSGGTSKRPVRPSGAAPLNARCASDPRAAPSIPPPRADTGWLHWETLQAHLNPQSAKRDEHDEPGPLLPDPLAHA
jgi:hypothetical protein